MILICLLYLLIQETDLEYQEFFPVSQLGHTLFSFNTLVLLNKIVNMSNKNYSLYIGHISHTYLLKSCINGWKFQLGIYAVGQIQSHHQDACISNVSDLVESRCVSAIGQMVN